MNILITGFEPFHDHPINPSQLLVQNLPVQFHQVTLIKAILPVHHTLGPEIMLSLLNNHQPDAVIAFGLAGSRAKLSLERVAINLLDYSIADNAGVTITNQTIDQHGPVAYFSTLPLEIMLSTLVNASIPTEISLSAGAYLCNQVFYSLMHWVAQQDQTRPAGFIHMPALPEQAAQSQKPLPFMPLDDLVKAAHLILDIISQTITT